MLEKLEKTNTLQSKIQQDIIVKWTYTARPAITPGSILKIGRAEGFHQGVYTGTLFHSSKEIESRLNSNSGFKRPVDQIGVSFTVSNVVK